MTEKRGLFGINHFPKSPPNDMEGMIQRRSSKFILGSELWSMSAAVSLWETGSMT